MIISGPVFTLVASDKFHSYVVHESVLPTAFTAKKSYLVLSHVTGIS
jgi:hypothetical protein